MSESAGAGTSVSAQSPSVPAPQAPAPKAGSPAPESAPPQRYKVKVEGRELDVGLDDLLKDYQLKEASNRRFQQASEMAKKAQPALEAMEALQKGDVAKAKKLLPPAQFRKVMEDYLISELEYEQLPETERRRMAAEKRAQDLEDELKSERETKTKEKAAEDLARAGAQVDQEIADVIEKMGKKPTPYLVAAIVDEMLASLDGRGDMLPGEKAYQKAKARLDGQAKDYLTDLSDQEFIERMPAERMEAVRKHLLAQVKQAPRPAARESAPLKRDDSKPMTIDEAFAERERQLKSQRRKA